MIYVLLAFLLWPFQVQAAQILGGGSGSGSGQTVNADISSVSATTQTDPSTEKILKELTIPAGSLNQTGRIFQVHGSGRYTTAAAQTPTMRYRVKLCTVATCSSGTVLTLMDFTTAATTAATTNSWSFNGIIGTGTTGASGAVFSRWMLATKLGAAGDLTPEERLDQNNAASSAIDLTGITYLQVTVLMSTANAGNSVTQHIGYIDGGWLAACSIDASGLLTCGGGIKSGSGSTPGVLTLLEGTVCAAGTNSGEHNVCVDSSDSLLKMRENGGSLVTIHSTAYAMPKRIWFPAAGTIGTTPSNIWNLPTTNPAVATAVEGTNTVKGVLAFADGANTLSAQLEYPLPTTWTGNIDVRIKWYTSAIAGDVVWQVATICVADAETDDPVYNTASTVTDTAKGTTLQLNDASITSLTVTGCAAGELMHLKVSRDPTHVSDTLAATANLIGLELTIRELF